jgi:hypothetical protein
VVQEEELVVRPPMAGGGRLWLAGGKGGHLL